MRVVNDAASDVAAGSEQKVYWDTEFRDAKGRIVAAPQLNVPVADTHTHLDMLHHPTLALARAAAHGVDFVVSITDPTEDPAYTYNNVADWLLHARRLLDSWKLHVPVPQVRTTIGCHPHNAAKYTPEVERLLITAASRPITAAIGEIGLDYHYDKSPRPRQREVFKRQLALANEMMLPVSLHLREAHEDGLEILKTQGRPTAGALLHCFNLDMENLQPFLDLGCQVALSLFSINLS